MINATVILGTLQSVADRHGDPTALIYQRLFSAHPELEALFHMDRDGGVRASMRYWYLPSHPGRPTCKCWNWPVNASVRCSVRAINTQQHYPQRHLHNY